MHLVVHVLGVYFLICVQQIAVTVGVLSSVCTVCVCTECLLFCGCVHMYDRGMFCHQTECVCVCYSVVRWTVFLSVSLDC